jgi:hypothetical protein
MSFINDYEPDYEYGSLKSGEYTAEIESAAEAVSKNGNNMIKVNLLIEGKKFPWCIVAGNWFNSNFTKFCVCFGIRPPNFNFREWKGKRGSVVIKPDDRNPDFFKVGRLVVPAPGSGDTARKPEYNGQTESAVNSGQPRPPVKSGSLPPDFSDDIPF